MRAIDVRDLIEHPGAQRSVHLEEPVEGLRLELAEVPEDRPISGDLLLESVVEGILVSGPIHARVTMSCARCLKPFDAEVDLEVQELFAAEGDDEGYPIGADGELDVEPMLRDAVLLSLPFSPLCRPDCLGLCERCGGDRNLGECACPPRAADARWAPLEGLLERIDE